MASSGVNQKPITARHQELFAMPSIRNQLPVKFDNGSCWTEYDGYCLQCENLIDASMVRGIISMPIARTAVIEAVGICQPCRVLTPFYNRLHDDMRISAIKDGKWCTWEHEPSWFDMLKGLLGRIFQITRSG